jgi:hypothetical protein
MTTRFTIRHTFDVDLERYWRDVFFNPEYNRRLYTEALAFKRYEVLSQATHPDGSVTRTVRLDPPFEPPGPAKRIFTEGLGYTETGRFDANQKRWTYAMTPRVLPDKISSRGSAWAEPRGTSRIERIVEVEVTVKVLGLGGVIESFVERMTRESYEKATKFTADYLSKLR